MIDRVKTALTRKLGPLPAWAWLVIAGVGIYLYRKRNALQSGTGTGSVAQVPPTPQPDTVLQPGESLYDPNSGTLTTAPGGDGSGGTDPTGAIAALAQAIQDAITAAQTPAPPQETAQPSTLPPGDTGATPTPTTRRKAKGRDKDKKRKPPKTRMGGLVGKQRARSDTSVRGKAHTPKPKSGGFILGRKKGGTRYGPDINRHPARTAASGRLYRSRPTTPATQTTVRQRPVAANRPAHAVEHVPAPRPSAPPPRTHRTRRKAR